MKHAREDYNRIQDPENKIPQDEPVFLLRGQDKTAPQILRLWAAAQRNNPRVDPQIIYITEQHAIAMENWQKEHGDKWADLVKTN